MGEIRRRGVETREVIIYSIGFVFALWILCWYLFATPWWLAFIFAPICVFAEMPRLRCIDDNATMTLIPLGLILVLEPFLLIMSWNEPQHSICSNDGVIWKGLVTSMSDETNSSEPPQITYFVGFSIAIILMAVVMVRYPVWWTYSSEWVEEGRTRQCEPCAESRACLGDQTST